jgi:hypothetical protein
MIPTVGLCRAHPQVSIGYLLSGEFTQLATDRTCKDDPTFLETCLFLSRFSVWPGFVSSTAEAKTFRSASNSFTLLTHTSSCRGDCVLLRKVLSMLRTSKQHFGFQSSQLATTSFARGMERQGLNLFPSWNICESRASNVLPILNSVATL